ncbi:MAG: hypothetical protein HUU02_16745 [Bacteroidetes bacterium]|nr:hypothetical protein [Bacteroidota bacterium]
MIDRLFAMLDVDRAQWTALMRFTLRSANRTPRVMLGQHSRNQATELNRSLIPFFLVNLMYGLAYCIMVFMMPSLSWSVFIIFSMTSVAVGMTMLLEFGSLIVAPEDLPVLAYRPVSSRTFFAVKAAFTLFYVILTTLSLGLPSCVAMALRSSESFTVLHFRPEIFFAAVIGIVLLGMATALGMIILYTSVLRYIRSSLLQGVLNFLQVMMSMVIFGSYILLPQLFGKNGPGISETLPDWMYLFPQTWYASMVYLMDGTGGMFAVIGAGAAVVLTAAVFPAALLRIANTYVEDIARSVTEYTPAHGEQTIPFRRRVFRSFSGHETRAMAVLVWGQFKSDTQFRMSILGMVPLVLFYLYMGLIKQEVTFDPFGSTLKDVLQTAFIYIPLLIFPVVLTEGVAKSRSHAATWIFFTLPVDRAQLILSMEKLLYRFFMMPYVVFLAGAFYVLIPDLLHGVLHAFLLLLFSAVTLKILFLIYPRIPFNRPVQFAEKVTMAGILTSVIPLLMTVGMLMLFPTIYAGFLSYGISITVLLATYMLLERMLRRRVEQYVLRTEYVW